MADLKTRFSELTHMKYTDQAKWFLNGFWKDGAEGEKENIWKYTYKCIELDEKLKTEGTELDEFQAHKFLESLGETLTVIALRDKLRKIDMDANGRMALLEYLAFRYSKSVQQIIDAPQGENQEQVAQAQAKVEEAQRLLAEVQKQLEEQTRLLEAQRAAEEALKKSEAELRAAIDDLEKQEAAYHGQIEILTQKSQDPSASTVAKSKAANELAQLKSEDPLPLRKAKITQHAALRKVEKERKAAEVATAAAEEQTQRVEKAYRQAEESVREAEAYLEEVKKKGGTAQGQIWWMERELKEAQKYLPKKKQTA